MDDFDVVLHSDAVPALDGSTPGTDEIIITVPVDTVLHIIDFGGSSQGSGCEVEIAYTNDGGTTWGHIDPKMSAHSKAPNHIRCLHLWSGDEAPIQFHPAFKIVGGAGIKIRLRNKNYGGSVSEIESWIRGHHEGDYTIEDTE